MSPHHGVQVVPQWLEDSLATEKDYKMIVVLFDLLAAPSAPINRVGAGRGRIVI